MARRMTSSVLVGRSDALDQLLAVLAATRAGQPRHVLVSGEAGVGKSRLLSRMRELAERDGALVLADASPSQSGGHRRRRPRATALSPDAARA